MTRRAPALAATRLEDRLAPASVRFDYTFDDNQFFADPARRAVLEKVGAEVSARLGGSFAAVVPSGGNTWAATFFHPATGATAQIPNLTVAADTIVVYVGGRNLTAAEAGEGGTGGYRASGDAAWLANVQKRGQTGFSLWGGAISFDSDQRWYTGEDPAGIAAGQTDLYSVAAHELGHVLGFGTAAEFIAKLSGNQFTGANAAAANGGRVPNLSADLAHWAQGTTAANGPSSMQPYLTNGKRIGLTELDYAALADIGWTITEAPPSFRITPAPASPPTPTQAEPTPTPVQTTPTPAEEPAPAQRSIELAPKGCNCAACLAVSGTAGTVQLVDPVSGGSGPAVQPFADFTGTVRASVADLTGDGTAEVVAVTGPGGGSRVAVMDGETGAVLNTYSVFEPSFTGGLFVATADLNADGKAEIVVSPDQGGGGRVTVLAYDGSFRVTANYFGIEDTAFRGGARVAAADVNGDGSADIVVAAGFGGGPRVSVWDGRTVTSRPAKLTADFFAFAGSDVNGLRNGLFVAAGDLNGDGKAEVVFGGGPGGGPRVTVWDGATLASQGPEAARGRAMADFFAFDGSDRGGVRVAVREVNGKPALIAGSGDRMPPAIKVYDGDWANGNPGAGRMTEPFGAVSAADGVFVG